MEAGCWMRDKGRGRCEGRKNPNSLLPVGMLATQEEGHEAHPSSFRQLQVACWVPTHSLVAWVKCISLFLHIMGIDHRPGLFAVNTAIQYPWWVIDVCLYLAVDDYTV